MTNGTSANDSKTFVLRLWAEDEGSRRSWRFSLEDPLTRGRRGFGSVHEIGAFLARLCADRDAAPHAGSAPARKLRRRVATLALAAFLPCGDALAQAPRLALGHAAGTPGSTVAVPVVLSSGEEPVGALSLRLRVEPPSAAASVTFRKASAWASRRTAFEARPQAGGTYSWIVSLAEPTPIPSDAIVGEVVVRLVRDLPPGAEVSLVLDPEVSGFGDRAGTRFLSAEAGGLLLADGTVDVVARIEPDEKR